MVDGFKTQGGNLKKDEASQLTDRHDRLVHSRNRKVQSHVQRVDEDWVLNTVMLEGVNVPFRYRRKKKYKSLAGARVNLTYYP